jgi:hypothetical protein
MVNKLKKGETVGGKTYNAAFLLIRGRREHCLLQCMSPVVADFVAEVGDFSREPIASIC